MATVLLIGAALSQPLFSQDVSPGPSSSAPTPAQAWEFSVAAYTYFAPDETNYVSPYIKADRKWLHLEARYNYEDQETGSFWIGYNFRTGNNFVFELTPMIGAVGQTQGVAPGALMSMAYKKFDLSLKVNTSSPRIRPTTSSTPGRNWATHPSTGCGWVWPGREPELTRLRWRFSAAHLWGSLTRT